MDARFDQAHKRFGPFFNLKAVLPRRCPYTVKPGRVRLQQIALLGAVLAASNPLPAFDQTNNPAVLSSNALDLVSSTPPLPLRKSPVDVFRELLAQSPSERTEFLAKRTPESRKLILAKLREYDSLTPEECALRLEVTELRWYLLPLMKTPAASREEQLATVPGGVRKLVTDRLERWNKLPPQVQKQVLENEDILRYYFECIARSGDQASGSGTRSDIPWNAVTDQQRQALKDNLQQFLGLTPEERDKILHTLSEPERLEIAKSLQRFANLTPVQRAECLRSFAKFASLSAQETQQFLKSAEMWKTLSPTERQSWKDLVYKLSRLPPIPPGVGFPPLPAPLPMATRLPDSLHPVTTNAHN